MLHTYNPQPMSLSTSYTLQFPRYSQDKILKVKVTTARSALKSRSHQDVPYLQPPTNVPIRYQLPSPYGFRDITRKRFHRSRSLWQGQRLNQGHNMTLHTYNPQSMSLSGINVCMYLYSAQYLHILQDSKRYLTNPTEQVQPQLTSNSHSPNWKIEAQG